MAGGARIYQDKSTPSNRTMQRRKKALLKAAGYDYSKKKNPAKRVSLKNFTGTITKNPNGTVSIRGRKK
jgi:hypothetical protein